MKTLEKAISLVKKLKKSGYETFLAGGAVRDRIRGIQPQDYDIATAAQPEQVKEILPSGIQVGEHFGVVLVSYLGSTFEIATFRIDGEYEDGRRPISVTYASAREDALRRDFTMNGVFYDPIDNVYLDYVEGQSDIKKGIIRAIGTPTLRFQEDSLRLLRAVRFSVQTGYSIEQNTYDSIQSCAPLIKRVSKERVQLELNKILIHPSRAKGLDVLRDTGLLSCICPDLMRLVGCEQPPQWHPEGDVYQHTRLALTLLPEESSLPLCLAVLLHDIGKPATYQYDEEYQRIRFNGHDKVGARMARKILHDLRYSNDIIEQVVTMVEHHMQFINVQNMRVAKCKRFLARVHIEEELTLHWVDCMSSNGNLDNYEFLRERQKAYADTPLLPPPLITGRDLIELGYTPGPEFKKVLHEIQTQQIEGQLNHRLDALQAVKEIYNKYSCSPE